MARQRELVSFSSEEVLASLIVHLEIPVLVSQVRDKTRMNIS